MPIPVIMDTDPGIDDALALALAVRSPELQVLAVATTYGNATVAATTRNASHLLARLGAGPVPVLAGAARPLVRAPAAAAETHGAEGLGFAQVPPAGASPPNRAAQGILALLAARSEPVTWVALGPLTNLALALALDRDGVRRGVREVVWMGGSAGAPGNTTPVSEFNAWCDPEAARGVTESGIPLRMVGLDATRCVHMSAALVEELGRHPEPEVRWWAEMWRYYVAFHRRQEGLEGCIMNDPLAVALLLQPGLGRWQEMAAEVECGWGATRGQTVCDRFGATGRPKNAAVCLEADGEAALRLALGRGLGVRL